METEARARGLASWARGRALGDSVSGHGVAAAKVPSAYTRMAARSVNSDAHCASAQRAFLIATHLLDIELTSSQQTRKHFLIATFSDLSWHRQSCLCSSVLICCVRKLVKSAERRTGKIVYATKTGLPSSFPQAGEPRQSALEFASASFPTSRLTSFRFR
jgi:hypothetical protein